MSDRHKSIECITTNLNKIVQYASCINDNFIILNAIYHTTGKHSVIVETIIHNNICLYKKILQLMKCAHDKLLNEYLLMIKLHIDDLKYFISQYDECIFYTIFGKISKELCSFLEIVLSYCKTVKCNNYTHTHI